MYILCMYTSIEYTYIHINNICTRYLKQQRFSIIVTSTIFEALRATQAAQLGDSAIPADTEASPTTARTDGKKKGIHICTYTYTYVQVCIVRTYRYMHV